MRLIDWLKVTDVVGLYIIIYEDIDNYDEPSWTGWSMDIPWTYVIEKFSTRRKREGEAPVEYRSNLGDEYNNKAGFIICLDGEMPIHE